MIYQIITLCLISLPAYAYIDPGIGAMFIQGLIAAIMLIPLYYKKIINYIKAKLLKKDNKDSIND